VSSVALAGCSDIADPDAGALVAALGELGVAAEAVAWDDPGADWSRHDLTVVRSTWGYDMDLAGFLAWARGLPRVVNPYEVLAWNADKHYLDDLAAAGVAVVPTTYATSGATAVLPAGAVVVKPSVGGGARGVAAFAPDEHALARAHVDALAAQGHAAMVQPRIASLAERGEVDVVVIDGEVTHAVGKHVDVSRAPAATPSGASRAVRRAPSEQERRVALSALRAVPCDGPLCYARVDLVATDEGPTVLELEVIEPFLFLGEAPGAARTLARAIAARLGR